MGTHWRVVCSQALIWLACISEGQEHQTMKSFLISLIAVAALGSFAYINRHIPDAEEAAFNARFDREAVLVKTCGLDPGIAAATPLKVYRLEGKLWYRDFRRWRQVDGDLGNVCDLLDIDKGHETKPSPRR